MAGPLRPGPYSFQVKRRVKRLRSPGLHDRSSDFASDAEGYLFEPALRTLGRLEPDEMYGFEPALVAGGTAVLANLRRAKLHPHLLILRQLAQPTLPFSGGQVDQLLKQQGF